MTRYWRLPTQTEAVQLSWGTWNEVCELLGDALRRENPGGARTVDAAEVADTCGEPGPDYISLQIRTAHGHVVPVRHGDWILPDAEPGTFYPVTPDVFARTYGPTAGTADLDAVYRERNRCVAGLARLFPGISVVVPAPDYEGWWLVFIDHPEVGQMSWHFSPQDLDLFDGIPRADEHAWDGHSTEEKYERLDRLAAAELTVQQLAHALDNATPYPVELDSQVCALTARELLKMLRVSIRPEHPLWSEPDDPAPAATVEPSPAP